LFFRRGNGALASPQAVNARMRVLVRAGLVDVLVLSTGRGSGAYSYGTTRVGALGRRRPSRHQTLTMVWHEIEIAEFRVRLEEALTAADGALVEWQGERFLRRVLMSRSNVPIPDAVVHWRLQHREGVFMLEWDRGTEPLSVLTAKLSRYRAYAQSRGHRDLLPGLGLRPRLAIVVHSLERKTRLIDWITGHERRFTAYTLLIGASDELLAAPLDDGWWRTDLGIAGSIVR
jgi:hypothetical protein